MSITENDITRGIERTEVSVETCNVDKVADFVYVRKNVPGPGLKSDSFADEFQGCNCSGESECAQTECQCIQRCGCAYDEHGVLMNVNPFDNYMKPVYECNKYCSCPRECSNRVVQNGVCYRLQVFCTKNKGFGLKTLQNIAKDTFVCEYAGEILSAKVAKHRAEALRDGDSNYILVLKEHLANGEAQLTYVDPTYIGNLGRFINHSCEPNLYMVPVRVDCDVPCLALFALCDIEIGEELSFNYSGEIQSRDEETQIYASDERRNKLQQNLEKGMKPCFCGSVNCCGILPYDESLYKPPN